jgi:alkane 1-monooxygenase
LYAFLPRTVWGNLVDGYGFEAKRRKKQGIPFWSLQNKALLWVGAPLALAAAAWTVYGLQGLAFLVGQALVAISMLETVNYIEHYGLLRQRGPDGRYERVAPHHSFNAATMYTNAVTFRLQRHSDHHAHEDRPYQLLRDIRDAPELPAG